MWQLVLRRSLLTVSFVLASFLAYLLYNNAESLPTGRMPASSSLEKADASISQFMFTQTKDEAIQWQVRAQQARLFEAEKRAILQTVDVTLYGQKGKEMTVSGDEGTLDTVTKNFVLSNKSDPLVVSTESGYTIYTNHLAWTEAEREIRTEEPVRIIGHGLEVTGRGLRGHLDTEEFEVLEDVHVDVAPAS